MQGVESHSGKIGNLYYPSWEIIDDMSVIVYTTPTCGFCHQVKAYLNGRGVPFTEHDVSRDRSAAMRMVQLTGQQGVPVVVVDGQAVVGFDRTRIDQLLAQMSARKPKLGAAIAHTFRR